MRQGSTRNSCFEVNEVRQFDCSAAILDFAGAWAWAWVWESEPLNYLCVGAWDLNFGPRWVIDHHSSPCSRAGEIQDDGRRDKDMRPRNKLFRVLPWVGLKSRMILVCILNRCAPKVDPFSDPKNNCVIPIFRPNSKKSIPYFKP